MSVKTEYRKQVDAFCEKNNSLTAGELLAAAEKRREASGGKETAEVIEFPKKNGRRMWTKVLSAACIVIVCSLAVATTALAATGVLQDVLRRLFKDETSAELVEQGLYYEANQSGEDRGFRVDFIGVTGDKETTKTFFDVYVEDDELADDYDEIGLYLSSFGKETADGEEKEFMLPTAIGTKDPENGNLYHVTLEGGTIRMPSGQPMRMTVTQVVFNPTQSDIVIYDVNIEFSMDVPSTALHSAEMIYYEGRPFVYKDCTYYLNYVTYGVYHTELNVVFDYDGVSLEGQYESAGRLEDLLQADWREFVSEVSLVADGTEYKVLENDEGYGYIWCDTQGETGTVNRCYVNPRFPSFDYAAAKEVLIRQGETEYRLK